MNQEQARKIKADRPLSLTDGAPSVVPLGNAKGRIPSAMDYRILAAVVTALGDDIDETDCGVLMLYTCLHTSRAQIAELWREAHEPKKLWASVMAWLAGQAADEVSAAMEDLMLLEAEVEEQTDLDSGPDVPEDGKKKTTSPSSSNSRKKSSGSKGSKRRGSRQRRR